MAVIRRLTDVPAQIGRSKSAGCPTCGNGRAVTTLYALTTDGPVPLGDFVLCLVCGKGFVCRFCGEVVTPPRIRRHLEGHE